MEKTCFVFYVAFFFNVSYVSCGIQKQPLFKKILLASVQGGAFLFFTEKTALKIYLG